MKKIGIIGGGAAGICAAKKCLNKGYEVAIFEQTNNIGGTWFYTPEVNVHSSMYEGLRTNLPKEIMAFSDLPFPDHLPSFISHKDVLNYLAVYSKDFLHIFKFGCRVTKIEYYDGPTWRIHFSSNGHVEYYDCHIVFVCNGHYSLPYIPDIPGHFNGIISHSHNYRNPNVYANCNVAVVGNGASGTDIALELSRVAKKVYLLYSEEKISAGLPSNIVQLPKIKEFQGNKLLLIDSSLIEVNIVLFCTGYLYNFPFLNGLIQLKNDYTMVSPTFLHVAHVNFPDSFFFIGLNFVVIPFILFEKQVDFALASIEGALSETSFDEIKNWEENYLRFFFKLLNLKFEIYSFKIIYKIQFDSTFFFINGSIRNNEKIYV